MRRDDPSKVIEHLSPEERRRVQRDAFLRPISPVMVIIGVVSFVNTLLWWIVPLTLAAYAAVVFFDIRSPLFQSRVLDRTRRWSETRVEPLGDRNIFLERRARLQLRRKSCQKVDSAREAQQRVIVAIEGTGASTKLLLDGAVAKLYCVAESAS